MRLALRQSICRRATATSQSSPARTPMREPKPMPQLPSISEPNIMRYILILPVALALSGCTTAQLQKAQDVQSKVEAAVAANAVKIQAACADVLLVANNPLTDVAAAS